MYKTILVPLDGSKRAERILPYVEELAERCNAEVVLLTVSQPPAFPSRPHGSRMDVYQQEVEQAHNEAEAYLRALEGEFREKGVKARSKVVGGPVVKSILDAAEGAGASLIALASHGRTGLSQVFYGSVAAGVLHRADRPLLLIRSQFD